MSKRKLAQKYGKGGQLTMRTADQRRAEGLSAFRSGRYREAVEAWSNLAPDDAALQPALAEACFRVGVGEARAGYDSVHYEAALHWMPADPLYAYAVAVSYQLAGSYSRAWAAYQLAADVGARYTGLSVLGTLARLRADARAEAWLAPDASDDERALVASLVACAGKPKGRAVTQALRALAARWPGRASGAVLEALAYSNEGAWAEAATRLRACMQEDLPATVRAVCWNYLGVALTQMGDEAGAQQAWQSALQSAPHDRRARRNLAVLHAGQGRAAAARGDWPAARRAAVAGLALLPGDSGLSQLAVAAFDQEAQSAAAAGEWAKAIEYWQQARDLVVHIAGASPRPFWHNLAIAYEALNDWAQAAEAWRSLLRTRPRKKELAGWSDAHWAGVRKRTIACYRQAGQPWEAVTLFQQALKQDPDDLDMALGLAEALQASGREEAAYNVATDILERHPGHKLASLQVADLYGTSGQWQEAVEVLQAALKLVPRDADVRQRLGTAALHHAQERIQARSLFEARTQYSLALECLPEHPEPHVGLAFCDAVAKDLDAARGHLARGLALGHGQVETYIQAFHMMIGFQDLDLARSVLASAEADSGLNVLRLKVACGLLCVTYGLAFQPASQRFNLGQAPRRPTAPPATPLYTWGEALLAETTREDNLDFLHNIVQTLLLDLPELALGYARRLTALNQDVRDWMDLGLILGQLRQDKEAREIFRKAARMARQQGETDVAEVAENAARAVGTPLFALLLMQVGGMDVMDVLGELNIEDLL